MKSPVGKGIDTCSNKIVLKPYTGTHFAPIAIDALSSRIIANFEKLSKVDEVGNTKQPEKTITPKLYSVSGCYYITTRVLSRSIGVLCIFNKFYDKAEHYGCCRPEPKCL